MPIRPIKCFDVASVAGAFQHMQTGQHIGRIAVTLRGSSENTSLTGISNRPQSLELDQSASYMLIGGLGGLGRAVATWMVEHGARSLIFLSRSASLTPKNQAFVDELEDMGCKFQLARGSVTDVDAVRKAMKSTTHPLKGIIQMSMVLHDVNFLDMSFEDWQAVTSVKVQGTWNLHNVTVSEGINLDFLVLFSSLSGIIGQPGQANYASANTFLDAFVHYRTHLGLPASAIDLGAVRDIGVISRNPGLIQKMKASGYKPLNEKLVLDALQLAITSSAIQSCDDDANAASKKSFVVGLDNSTTFSSPLSRSTWKRDRRMTIYHSNSHGISTETTGSGATLKSYITNAKADPSVLKSTEAATFFATEIGKNLFALLSKPEDDVNTSLSLFDLGMDSLVAPELRTWWKRAFGFDISLLELRGMGTLEVLGRHAAEGLLTSMQARDE